MKKPVLTVKAVSRYMRPDASRLVSPLTRRPLRPAAGGRHAGEAAPEGAHVLLQHAIPAARLHVALPGVRTQPAARHLHGGARARLPQLRRGEQGGDPGLLGAGGEAGEAGGAHPPDQRGEQDVGDRWDAHPSYGFVHFEEKAAREKALIPAMRIFGVQIRNSLCRTGRKRGRVRRRAGGEQADALRGQPRARHHGPRGGQGAQRHPEAAPGD